MQMSYSGLFTTSELFQVSPEPDVEVHDLNRCSSRFIILASDGVTNMIKPDQAVNMVANFEDRKKAGVSVVWFNSNKIRVRTFSLPVIVDPPLDPGPPRPPVMPPPRVNVVLLIAPLCKMGV